MRRSTTGPVVGIFLFTISVAMMTACGERLRSSEVASVQNAAPPITDARAGAEANNRLSLILLQALTATSRPADNVLLAPASFTTALAMLSAGAAGNTAHQMTTALGFPDDLEAVNHRYGCLAQSLVESSEGLVLQPASRLWIPLEVNLQPNFVTTLKHDYHTDVGQVDFLYQSESARTAINQWVGINTGGLVPEMLSTLDPSARLVLTDAFHLQADWQQPFASKLSQAAPFHAPRGDIQANFMQQTAEFKFGNNAGYQIVELPYMGERIVMDVVLPDGDQQPWQDVRFFDELGGMLASLERRPVDLMMPIFRVAATTSMSEALAKLGIAEPFGGNADFSGMTGHRDLHLAEVVQKTFISVSERGTEAGASTASVVFGTVRAGKPAMVHADHPFLYLIRDTATGAYIMTGILITPELAPVPGVALTH